MFFSLKAFSTMNKDTSYIKQLLTRIAEDDDQEAFKIFFNLYQTRLLRFALIFVNFHHQAEDVVSEVMIKLLKKRQELLKIINFEGYLYHCIKNQALGTLKKNAFQNLFRPIEVEDDYYSSESNTPIEILLEDELRDLISNTIEKLPPRRKMIYKMIKDEGLKYREVALLLDISQKTVENHLDLGIRELRKTVMEYLEGKQDKIPIINIARLGALFSCFYQFI
jgi:RNA polymerase sigma-70 factor (ECF subfamily)